MCRANCVTELGSVRYLLAESECEWEEWAKKVWGENFTDYFSKQPNAVKLSLLTPHCGHF